MTAYIRTAAEAVPVFRFTNAQWREYQQIPDQGYSRRHWIEHQVNEWAARVTPTREQLSKLLYFQRVSDNAAENAPEISKLCDEAADAVLALIAGLAEGETGESSHP